VDFSLNVFGATAKFEPVSIDRPAGEAPGCVGMAIANSWRSLHALSCIVHARSVGQCTEYFSACVDLLGPTAVRVAHLMTKFGSYVETYHMSTAMSLDIWIPMHRMVRSEKGKPPLCLPRNLNAVCEYLQEKLMRTQYRSQSGVCPMTCAELSSVQKHGRPYLHCDRRALVCIGQWSHKSLDHQRRTLTTH